MIKKNRIKINISIQGGFRVIGNKNEHNLGENPNWYEANQLAIYKRGRGVELGCPLRNKFSDQSGT